MPGGRGEERGGGGRGEKNIVRGEGQEMGKGRGKRDR